MFWVSVALIMLPLYFGFPVYENGYFIQCNHGDIAYVSKMFYIVSKVAQVVCSIGIILLVVSFLLIQKHFGFKPTLISVLINPDFLKKMFSEIRNDYVLIFICTLDLVLFIFGVAY